MATLTGGDLGSFRDQLKRAGSGSIRVLDAQLEPRLDRDGDEYLQVTLVVSEPPAGEQTWSLDDAFRVRQEARRMAADAGVTTSLAITMTMAGEPGTDDDPTDEPTEAGGDGE